MKRTNLILIVAFICIYSNASWAQQNPFLKIGAKVATDNATQLTKPGSVPVDYSTGQPRINVNVYTVTDDNYNFPISLNYDASGIRVDQHPTWVGLGWSLSAGGAIRRIVHGMPDDYYFPDENGGVGTYLGREKGYLFCGNSLNNENWASIDSLAGYSLPANAGNGNPHYLADGIPDDFAFNFNGYSGSFFLDETGTWRVKSQNNLGIEIKGDTNSSPVVFNPCTSMKVNKLLQGFQITTPDGIKYFFGYDINAVEFSRAVYDDFYSNLDGDATLFHLTPNAWYISKIVTPQADTILFTYERGKNLIRLATSIQSTEYDVVDHHSSTSRFIMMSGSIISPSYLQSITTSEQKIHFFTSLTHQQVFWSGAPWQESGPNGTIIARYVWELERRMWENTDGIPEGSGPDNLRYRGWWDFSCAGAYDIIPEQPLPDYSKKLDSIVVFNKDSTKKIQSFAFHYTDDSSQDPHSLRLFLDSFSIKGGNGEEGGIYTFFYKDRNLVPNYCEVTKDQWGYYNGDNYSTSPNMYNDNLWRLPQPALAQSGVLEGIENPEGGMINFTYELNDYSKYEKVIFSDNIGNAGSLSLKDTVNTLAGGLRIKEISTYNHYGAPTQTRQFFYSKNYINGGSTSSGILSSKNTYSEHLQFLSPCSGNYGFSSLFSDNEFDGIAESSPIVSYSEVTEINSDGSKKVYKYTNFDDPGCLDEFGLQPFILGAAKSQLFQLTSNVLERGLLKSEEYYNSQNSKVWQKVYEYKHDPGQKDQFAKCVQKYNFMKQRLLEFYGEPQPCDEALVLRMYPFKKYFYNIPVIKTTETNYESGQSIATTKQYQYDDYGNITQEVTYKSTGEKIQTDTRYNSNPDYLGTATGSTAKGIKNLFTNYHIKNYPVEQTTLLFPAPSPPPIPATQKFTSGKLYLYNQTKPVISNIYKFELDNPSLYYNGATPTYSPSRITSGNLVYDSRYKLQESIPAYSANFGKPLTIADIQKNTAYTWDNNTHYVSSQTTNATYTDVAYCNFDGGYAASGADENKGNWDFSNDFITVAGAPMGDACYRLAATHGIGSLNQLQTKNNLASGKSYVLSFWLKGPVTGNTYPNIYNGTSLLPGYAPKKALSNGWNYYEIQVLGTGNKIKLGLPEPSAPISVATPIDEIRLYPSNGAMKSYVYDAATGNITATCDASNNVTHYEYDGLGRLLTVKDENGKILKSYTYQYQGAQ